MFVTMKMNTKERRITYAAQNIYTPAPPEDDSLLPRLLSLQRRRQDLALIPPRYRVKHLKAIDPERLGQIILKPKLDQQEAF